MPIPTTSAGRQRRAYPLYLHEQVRYRVTRYLKESNSRLGRFRMSLKEIQLEGTLSSEDSNLLERFYVPALRESVIYKRAVGYFSAQMLCHAAQGLAALYENGGQCQLVIGDPLDDDEYDAVKKGYNHKRLYERIESTLNAHIYDSEHPLYKNRLALIGALTARGLLEIKFAYRSRGMYHDKSGVFIDAESNRIAFSGSANETVSALLPENNIESIFAYPSWRTEVYALYGAEIEERLERLWNGTANNTVTVDCPSNVYEILAAQRQVSTCTAANERKLSNAEIARMDGDDWPRLPEYLAGNQYALRRHQEEALEAWRAYDFKGMLAHATGSGKTVTALHAATRLAEYHRSVGRSFYLVVSVPYQVLAEQWISTMRDYNCRAIRCFEAKRNWKPQLDQEISDACVSSEPLFMAAVVVNRTLADQQFTEQIRRLPSAELMFVGDECHHHSSSTLHRALPSARYRLGLSATPYSEQESDRKNALETYYGSIVSTYGISDALSDGVLTQYVYVPYEIKLGDDEMEEYEQLTGNIVQYLNDDGTAPTGAAGEQLNALLSRRARLLGSARAKFDRLEGLVAEMGRRPYTLFYCGDGSTELDCEDASARDIERVAAILSRAGWKTSRITAAETRSQRNAALENFRLRYIDAVVAIRVLDEGFDMPSCSTAFMLASSRNPRQYVQRRGRILRRAPGKEYAEIVDFIVTPAYGHRTKAGTRLVENELSRAAEFTRSAKNRSEAAQTLQSIGRRHNLDFDRIERDVAIQGVEG